MAEKALKAETAEILVVATAGSDDVIQWVGFIRFESLLRLVA
jgi:hypothetical protein